MVFDDNDWLSEVFDFFWCKQAFIWGCWMVFDDHERLSEVFQWFLNGFLDPLVAVGSLCFGSSAARGGLAVNPAEVLLLSSARSALIVCSRSSMSSSVTFLNFLNFFFFWTSPFDDFSDWLHASCTTLCAQTENGARKIFRGTGFLWLSSSHRFRFTLTSKGFHVGQETLTCLADDTP